MKKKSMHRCAKRREMEMRRILHGWIDENGIEEEIVNSIYEAIVEHEKELLTMGFMEMGSFMEIMRGNHEESIKEA